MANSSNRILFYYILKLLLLTIFTTFALSEHTCTTPNGASGRCVPNDQCNYISKLLETNDLATLQYVNEYIEKARCWPPTHVCCEINISRFFSGLNYESSLNATGVNILKSIRNCGPSQQKHIANGVDASPGEYPWMAILRYDSLDQPFQCGGSLITERYVLTAAHCVKDRAFNLIGVRLGEHDLSTDIDCSRYGRRKICLPEVKNFGIEKVIVHPLYAKPEYDVALIKLDRNVVFGKYIKPICLPIIEEALKIDDNSRYFIAGWGYTENGYASLILQKTTVPHQDRSVCQNAFTRARITEVHICAGGENNTTSCGGDSGGPLFNLAPYMPYGAVHVPRTVQFGIVSFGSRTCGNNMPTIYTNIAEVMPWITSNLL